MANLRAIGRKIQLPHGQILARDVKVNISEYALGRVFKPAGIIGQEGRSIADSLLTRATARAPLGTGRTHYRPSRAPGNLKASHSVKVTHTVAGRVSQVKITLKNSANYALFVHEGTAGRGFSVYGAGAGSSGYGFIMARRIRAATGRPHPMARPLARGSSKVAWVYEVSGQIPKRWMIRAANEVLSKYGVAQLSPVESHAVRA